MKSQAVLPKVADEDEEAAMSDTRDADREDLLDAIIEDASWSAELDLDRNMTHCIDVATAAMLEIAD